MARSRQMQLASVGALLVLAASCAFSAEQDLIRALENYVQVLKGEKKVEGLPPVEIQELLDIHKRLEGFGTRRATTDHGCSPAIESQIEGEFEGWDGDTIFKLTNGQIWEQESYDYMYSYSYRPDVTIFQTRGGNCTLLVEGEDDTITVRRVK